MIVGNGNIIYVYYIYVDIVHNIRFVVFKSKCLVLTSIHMLRVLQHFYFPFFLFHFAFEKKTSSYFSSAK